MKAGIYSVQFASNVGAAGEGLVVIKDDTINGGDTGFLFRGTYQMKENSIQSSIKVSRYKEGHTSIFGPLKEFNLALTGQLTGDSFRIQGQMAEQPTLTITISGKRIADLATC